MAVFWPSCVQPDAPMPAVVDRDGQSALVFVSSRWPWFWLAVDPAG
jgi:hypothetical protein